MSISKRKKKNWRRLNCTYSIRLGNPTKERDTFSSHACYVTGHGFGLEQNQPEPTIQWYPPPHTTRNYFKQQHQPRKLLRKRKGGGYLGQGVPQVKRATGIDYIFVLALIAFKRKSDTGTVALYILSKCAIEHVSMKKNYMSSSYAFLQP